MIKKRVNFAIKCNANEEHEEFLCFARDKYSFDEEYFRYILDKYKEDTCYSMEESLFIDSIEMYKYMEYVIIDWADFKKGGIIKEKN